MRDKHEHSTGSPAEPELRPFDELDGDWLDHLRDAIAPREGGRVGDYEIRGEIRSGGQAIVYRARDPRTGRDVALKRLASGVLASERARRRFEREIEAACSLNHPSVVTAYGVEELNGEPVLAMEWVDGAPLDQWAARDASDRDSRLDVFLQVCDAVQHAHHNGVLHRDLKPANVLVDRGGRPRVLDFGLAKRLSPDADSLQTHADSFLGTPSYAAPEQLSGERGGVDGRTDVYALGVMLYELLCDELPFREEGLGPLFAAIESREPTRPSRIARSVARELDAIALKALAKRAEDRYQTVHALAEDVRRFLRGVPIEAMTPSPLYAVRLWIRRHSLVFGFSLALLVVSLAFSVYTGWQRSVIAAERDAVQRATEKASDARADTDRALGLTDARFRRAELAIRFFVEAMTFPAVSRSVQGPVGEPPPVPNVIEALEYAAEHASERFRFDPWAELLILGQVSRGLYVLGRNELAEEVIVRAIVLCESPGDAPQEAMLHTMLADLHLTRGRVEEARVQADRATAILRPLASEHPERLAQALGMLADILMEQERFAEAGVVLRESDALYRDLFSDDTVGVLITEVDLAKGLIRSGVLDEADVLVARAVERAERLAPQGFLHGEAIYQRGLLRMARGEVDEAATDLRRGIDLKVGEDEWTPDHAEMLGVLAQVLDDAEEHAEAAETHEAAARLANDPRLHVESLWGAGRSYERAGDALMAEIRFGDAYEESRAAFGDHHRLTFGALGDLCRVVGRSGEPREFDELFGRLSESLSVLLDRGEVPAAPRLAALIDVAWEKGRLDELTAVVVDARTRLEAGAEPDSSELDSIRGVEAMLERALELGRADSEPGGDSDG